METSFNLQNILTKHCGSDFKDCVLNIRARGSHSVLGNSVSGLKIQLLKSVENGLQPGSSV